MSALEHSDEAAVDRFTDAVDAALVAGAAGRQAITLRLMAMWVVAGVLLTLAVLANGALSTILYILGFAVLVVALAGPLRGAAPSA
jgi:hypothetical protein